MKMVSLKILSFTAIAIGVVAQSAFSQTDKITGTVLSFGTGRSTRTVTTSFTLTLTGTTSDDQTSSLIQTLQEDGQDGVLRALRKMPEVGRLQLGGQLAVAVGVVRRREVDGRIRIFGVLERDIKFTEMRIGSRSIDYPFSVIEIFIDPKTGNGEGTYLAAARIRMGKQDGGVENIQIEDFGTYPSRLMGVRMQLGMP